MSILCNNMGFGVHVSASHFSSLGRVPTSHDRIQSTEFAALGVALFGLLVISFGLALTAPIRSSLARLGEGLVRRRPDLTFLVHPILNLVVAIALVLLLTLSAESPDQSLWSLVPWRPLGDRHDLDHPDRALRGMVGKSSRSVSADPLRSAFHDCLILGWRGVHRRASLGPSM